MYALDYTATIQRPVISNVDGQDKKTFTTVYASIPCMFYEFKGTLTNTNIASETQNNKFKVILEPDKVVYIGDKIAVDNRVFIIEDVKNQKLIGNIHHIALIVKQL